MIYSMTKKNFTGLLTPEPESELPQFDSIAENILKNRFDIRIAKQQIDVAKKILQWLQDREFRI